MNALSPYHKVITDSMDDAVLHSQNVSTSVSQSFISLLELVSEICQVRNSADDGIFVLTALRIYIFTQLIFFLFGVNNVDLLFKM